MSGKPFFISFSIGSGDFNSAFLLRSAAQEVTRSLSSSVRLFVRPLFLILKFSCSLKPTMLSKLLTIVLGVKLHEMNISKALKFQFEAEN